MSQFSKKEIQPGEHVGDILRQIREECNLTREELATQSNVQLKYIIAFEEYRYHELPGVLYGRNFLKSIAGVCNINPDRLVKRFEEEARAFPFRDNTRAPQSIPATSFWTPKRLRTAGIIGFLVIALLYIGYELRGFVIPPDLQIIAPKDNIEVNAATVTVSGKTDPGVKVTINGTDITVDDAGSFTAAIDVADGVNTITIVATHKFGRQNRVVRNLFARP